MHRTVHRLGILAAVLVALGLAACGDEEETGPRPPSTAELTARARAAAHFAREEYAEAKTVLAPLLDAERPAPADLVRMAIVTDWLGGPGAYEEAVALFERALKREPDLAAAHYGLGVLLQRGDLEAAVRHMRRARALAPRDYPTALQLGHLLTLAEKPGEAARVYEDMLDIGVEEAGSWHLITLYALAQLRIRAGERAAATALLEERAALQARGVTVPSADELRRGDLGRLHAPAPKGTAPAPVPPAVEHGTPIEALAGMAHVRAVTVEDDWAHGEETCFVAPPDLLAWGAGGLAVARHTGAGFGTVETVHGAPVTTVAALDLDRDGLLDLVFVSGGALHARLGRADGWAAAPFALPSLPAAPTDLAPVDFDHDGDLDLLLVGSFGARLWRNDGLVEPGGTLTDASAAGGMPTTPLAWCLVEDLDTDQDVDLLLGGPAGPALLADNLRGGRFATGDAGLGTVGEEPVVADLDGDARPDVVLPGAPPRLRPGRAAGGFGPARPLAGTPASASVVDLDLDGAPDLAAGTEAGGLAGLLAAGTPAARAFETERPGGAGPSGGGAFADLDGDRAFDHVACTETGLAVLGTKPAGAGFLLALRGVKDNPRGVGAVVEVRAGPVYRRIFWRGEPTLVGLGDQPRADVLRVTWPNGVVQYDMDLDAGCARLLEQTEGLVGSCPFLYSWDGTTYAFVTDVLGITPLGLPMAPGMIVPPDHDEYVLVRGEQCVPRTLEDGTSVYEMQLTEELREVTYLDQTRLVVVDHPEHTEVKPNERFTFPPFPEPHVHVVRPFPPVHARGSDGTDWTKALAAEDADYAAPFTPRRGQMQGLCSRHWVELAFDPERVPAEGRLRLLLTGWFYWTDASVNLAAARTPGIAFEPPVLLVPERPGAETWRAAGPPVGFPAGKRKTMVLDVSDVLDREDPRLRVATTLRLYWDAARLAVGEDAPARQTEVEVLSAHLWERGFSKPIPTFGEHRLEWFRWDERDRPRWNPHPGMYTRLGEVVPLVREIDDRFVIMAAGDALRLRFSAARVPPLPAGWRRDFLLFLDGWAKDRDPNTLEALHVEPLPFHGMSGYPYGPEEAYPDDAAHRAYRDTWNTRPARTWVRPVRPTPHAAPGR